jgi:protein-serine/threonine kinase
MPVQVPPPLRDRATAAKLQLEAFYTTLLEQTHERIKRKEVFDEKLAATPEDKKAKVLAAYSRKESDFLRLRRVRLAVSDFITVKVIGKGAFGEVNDLLLRPYV